MKFQVCGCGKPAIGVVCEHLGDGKSPMAGVTRGHYACEDCWKPPTWTGCCPPDRITTLDGQEIREAN